MTPYTARKLPASDLALAREATALVARIPETLVSTPELRCHELAVALSRQLARRWSQIGVAHGRCSRVQHSWLWTRRPTGREADLWRSGYGWSHEDRPLILDAYTPGVLPQVLLLDTWALLGWWGLYEWEEGCPVELDGAVLEELAEVLAEIDIGMPRLP